MSIELNPHPHQSYSNGFFMLRMPLIINGQPAEISCNDKGMLTLNCRYPSIDMTFASLFNDVSTVVEKYGLSGITNYWCEDVPLFQLKFSTQDGMKRFISTAEMVQHELASKISARLAEQQQVICRNTSQANFPIIVHTEVFLVTPDPINKDAVLRVVTAESLSTCLSLWRESTVFNFGALFRAYRTRNEKDCGPPTICQLVDNLRDVVEWYQIGIHLDIPESDLKEIWCDNHWSVTDCKREMLSTWLRRNPQPTWATIVTTLTDIGKRSLAYKIAFKFGIPTPSLEAKRIPTLKNHDPVQQKICNQVEEIRSGIESKERELMVKKQISSEAQNARVLAREKFERVKRAAVQVQTRVTQLITKMTEMLKLLEQKERGLRTLQTIQEREKGELQSLIDERNDEIKKLNQELQAVQAELTSEKQNASSLQKQLQQANEDLAFKSARVQELEWARQKLVALLDNEGKRVDQLLMQQTAASNSPQQYTKEIENQLFAARQESEAKATEMEALKKTIAHKEGEVKGLCTQLQSQEALLQRLLTQPPEVNAKPDLTQDLKEEEELKRLAVEVEELRTRLIEAEDAKQDAQRQMKVTQLDSKLLSDIITELRAARQPPPIKPKPTARPTVKPEPAARPTVESKSAVMPPPTVKPKPAVKPTVKPKPTARTTVESKSAVMHPPTVKPKPAVKPTVKPKTAVKPTVKPEPVVRQLPTIEPTYTPVEKELHYAEPETLIKKLPVSVASAPKPTEDPVSLQPGAPLKWECCADLPVGMRDAQAVVLGNKVYVGGGVTQDGALDLNIYVSEFTSDIAWRTLKGSTKRPALTTYQERLVLVGGRDPSTGKPTNQLWMMEDEQAWIQPLPPMPTPRSRASAVSTQQYLITAGGMGRNGADVAVVEVYNGEQWVTTDPLPMCCYFMKSTLHDGFLYLMGGTHQCNAVFQCSLQALTLQNQSLWNSIEDVPYKLCSVSTFGGALVAVGGQDNGKQQKSLHMYDPLTQSWVHAGEIPNQVDHTCTVTLPSGEMLVIGGARGSEVTKHSPLVYKASLKI